MANKAELIAEQLAEVASARNTWGSILYNVKVYGLVGDGVTDDTAALQTLINKAISEGRRLIFFPHGTYKVTTITNDNQVVFVGDNAMFTGGYTGTIEQFGAADSAVVTYNGVTRVFQNKTQTLYVAPDAQVFSGNDGLTTDKPVKLVHLETIFGALQDRFAMFFGRWTVQLAAGTYQGDGTDHMLFLHDIQGEDYVVFQGEDVPFGDVPTTVLDGKTFGVSGMHGFYFQNMTVNVKNIKFQNFTEDNNPSIPAGNRAGLSVSGEGCRLWAYNIHAYNCSWAGIANQGIKRIMVEGGKLEYCRLGIVSMFSNQVSIGYHGSTSKPETQNTRLVNCVEAGVMLQAQTGGHVDYCIFDGNDNRGLQVSNCSECNAVSNTFRNNLYAISAESNSKVLDSGNIFTNNTQNFEQYYGGQIQRSTNSDSGNRSRNVSQLMDTAGSYFIANPPSGGGVLFSQLLQSSSLFGRGKTFNLVAYGRVSNISPNTCNLIVKVTDGVTTTTLQSIPIPSTSGYQQFKLECFLSNWTQSSFIYNSDFYNQATGTIVTNLDSIPLDSTRDITFSLEVTVSGTAANTVLSTYRIIPRVTF